MPWDEVLPMDQKSQFVSEYQRQTVSFSELCQRYSVSRKTGYKWVRRFELDGRSGLEDRSRRPQSSPNETVGQVQEWLVEARRHHPSWGAKKLLKLVGARHPGVVLPSRSTVCDVLTREGLVRQRVRRRKPSHPGRPMLVAASPNDLWCVDFKGQFRTRDGRYCYPLTVTDQYSRYLLACTALLSPNLDGTKRQFDQLFEEHGLPRAIRSDNGAPFASTALARVSTLSAWWIGLGIFPELTQPGKPQQNGRHERMHRTLKAETTRPPEPNLRRQQERFDAFRREYNEVRPHEGIELETPASRYADSERSLAQAPKAITYPAHYETRRVSENGGIRWHNHWVGVSTTLSGKSIGLVEVDHEIWDVYFGPIKLGRFLEDRLRIEDDRGRLTRRHV